MALSCGIVGLPNVGKSTLFNALTRSAQALAANYPFATIEPNVGEVGLPDERLQVLGELNSSERIVPATMRFVDIAGLVRGASTGQGLGNAFLGHIRETDAIAMVVRCFEEPDVIHVEGDPDPIRDADIVGIELALADLDTMQKRVPKLERQARTDPKIVPQLEAAQRLVKALEDGQPARVFPPGTLEAGVARESFLISAIPVLYVANIDESQIAQPGPLVQRLRERAAAEGAALVVLCAKLEAELAGMSDEDAKAFAEEMGIHETGLAVLIHAAYGLLGMMTFLTAGEKETRAWPIQKGTKAPQAAGKIHSDIERGFIRAEIVSYEDLVRLKTMEAARSAGVVRQEGKEYTMREGDVVNFKFNV